MLLCIKQGKCAFVAALDSIKLLHIINTCQRSDRNLSPSCEPKQCRSCAHSDQTPLCETVCDFIGNPIFLCISIRIIQCFCGFQKLLEFLLIHTCFCFPRGTVRTIKNSKCRQRSPVAKHFFLSGMKRFCIFLQIF